MTDIVTTEVRSRLMSGIRSSDTKPELLLRRGLHQLGFRFKLNDKSLPGKPDIVLPRYRSVIFVHGCFWHQHNCHLFKMPSTRTEFWSAKFNRNIQIDKRAIARLIEMEWRVGTVWECALRGKTKRPYDEVINACANWLRSEEQSFQIEGSL